MEFSSKMCSKLTTKLRNQSVRLLVCGIAILSAAVSTGCQSNYAGQTLPSAYFMNDDIQYFVKGPQFKLHREAAALQEARAEAMTRR
jgi:hypothetical protein